MKKSFEMTLEELVKIPKSVLHRISPKMVEKVEKALNSKEWEKVQEILEDHSLNLKKRNKLNIRGSSKGRTRDFESLYLGSNPSSRAKNPKISSKLHTNMV